VEFLKEDGVITDEDPTAATLMLSVWKPARALIGERQWEGISPANLGKFA
jgi:hypothetical protein